MPQEEQARQSGFFHMDVQGALVSFGNKRSARAPLFGFSAWMKECGGIGDREVEKTLERIKTFFQKHAETRFCKIDSCGELGR